MGITTGAPRPFHYHDPMNTLHRPAHPATGRFCAASPVIATLLGSVLITLSWMASAQTTAPTATTPDTTAEPVVNSKLNAPLFYQLLLGEMQVSGLAKLAPIAMTTSQITVLKTRSADLPLAGLKRVI